MVDRAISLTIEREPELLRDTAARRPTAWGALAARGIVTFRELAGRKATDDERRAIWAGLWRAAEATAVHE